MDTLGYSNLCSDPPSFNFTCQWSIQKEGTLRVEWEYDVDEVVVGCCRNVLGWWICLWLVELGGLVYVR